MATTIAVAGATGDLGARIVKALAERGADVRALARNGAGSDKLEALESLGVKVAKLDMSNVSAVAEALQGASCIVSTIQGLRDVIVDAQTVLLEAALAAGVPASSHPTTRLTLPSSKTGRTAISTSGARFTSASTTLRLDQRRS